jgi:hypothetical protein
VACLVLIPSDVSDESWSRRRPEKGCPRTVAGMEKFARVLPVAGERQRGATAVA